MSDAIKINGWLKENFGQTIDGHANFRVVWSTNLLENRFGKFNEYSGDIFLREFKGVRPVPKYPFDQNRWVLEMYAEIHPNSDVARELVDCKFSYEPMFVFKDSAGAFLPLNQNAIAALLYFFLNRDKFKRDKNQIQAEWDKKEHDIDQRTRDFLDDQLRSPYFMDLVY